MLAYSFFMDYSQAECYTIGKITEKYDVSPSTVSNAIRRNSIHRKIGWEIRIYTRRRNRQNFCKQKIF